MSFTKSVITGRFAEMLSGAFADSKPFFEYNPGKFLMPENFDDIAEDVLNAEVRSDDIWLISYPRTGSTWLQEIVWLIGNNLDFEKAKNTIQQMRAPMIELSTYLEEYTNFMTKYGNSVKVFNNWPSPRFPKTHLPYEFLPKQMQEVNPKIIYIVRNPKDVCVSFYYYCKQMHGMKSTFEDFAELFLNDVVPMGSVLDHYLSFWKHRHEKNVLFLRYETLKGDTKAGIKQIAAFMEKDLTEEEVDSICSFLTVENMKKNSGCNWSGIAKSQNENDYSDGKAYNFIRKGIVGDWKNYMNEELSRRFDEWIAKNTEGTGLVF